MNITNNIAINTYKKFASVSNSIAKGNEKMQLQQEKILKNTTFDYTAIPASNDAKLTITPINRTSTMHKSRSFAEKLKEVVIAQKDIIKASEQQIQHMISEPETMEEHDKIGLISAINEAQIALELIVNVRDKILSAYMDIYNMPI